MSGAKTAAAVVSVLLGLGWMQSWGVGQEAVAQPATQGVAATQPVEKIHVVKKGKLSLNIQAEGMLLPVEPFEVKLKMKAYSGPLTVVSIAPAWGKVKAGDVLLELDPTNLKWAMEEAENGLATAKANLKKAEADAELADKGEALALRMQQDAVKNAEGAWKWWESVDGPLMLQSADLQVKYAEDAVGDQDDELEQLRKMYKSEELTNATADIVIKRAVRSLERAKITSKNQQEHREKTRAYDYPIARQRVLDGLEQARQQLASLKIAQEQAAVARKGSLASARIALEQAEKRVAELKEDGELFAVKSQADGVVMYGQVAGETWQGGDPKGLKAGERLAAGQVVMRVFTPGKMRMEIGLGEKQGFWVEKGMKAKVTPTAFPMTSYEATCGAVVAMPQGNAAVVGFQLPLTLPEVDRRLLPGMKASVHIEAGPAREVLLVPVKAVVDGKVWVKSKDGKVKVREVVVGQSDGQDAEVCSGVKEGEEVLAEGKK
ncbi:MAG: hypothetical protein ACM359_23970 [Bacillota bacterium]